jgi:hypothetical protein
MALSQAELTPAQLAVLDALRASPDERPSFDVDLGPQLRAALEDGLTSAVPAMDALGLDRLWISKHKLSSALGCERRFIAEVEGGFDGWTVPLARGTVAHRAIELSMHTQGEPVPAELVDHTLANFAETDTTDLGEFVRSLNEFERADLRSGAVDGVSAFLELWPPLNPRWRPRAESRVRVDLFDERVTLAGKVDLTVGHAVGTTAGKVLVDLKTGGFSPTHLDDLRFYALLETIRSRVPPRRVATHYLDSGDLIPEDVTQAMLESAVARVADAVMTGLELRAEQREPVTKPGPPCRWCSVLDQCDVGREHLAAIEVW